MPAPAHFSVTGFGFLLLCIAADERKREKPFHRRQVVHEG
jgi:hypothetical protein